MDSAVRSCLRWAFHMQLCMDLIAVRPTRRNSAVGAMIALRSRTEYKLRVIVLIIHLRVLSQFSCSSLSCPHRLQACQSRGSSYHDFCHVSGGIAVLKFAAKDGALKLRYTDLEVRVFELAP